MSILPLAPPAAPLLPDARGYFGAYGGAYVPEILVPNLLELVQAFDTARGDPAFWREYIQELATFSGRPTPITALPNLSKMLGGARILLKREDLGQTGAHKINNVIGQGILTRRFLKKPRLIAETGAGQHGVATATMAARYGFDATIYMGAEDVERQRPNVFWMERMGAKVVAVEDGARTLKDAINAALRDWATNVQDTHYVLGTVCGPHPFPAMVAWFQSVVGLEAAAQLAADGVKPSAVYACVGGGSNAIGIFQGFLAQNDVELVGVEAGGKGFGVGEHAARLAGGGGTPGIAQGYESLFLQNADGQMQETHSVAAGLDYVGVSPIIADLAQRGRIRAERASDLEVVEAVRLLMKHEGIIPALESSHALAAAIRAAPKLSPDKTLLVNLSGRGDKDIFTVAGALGDASWGRFLAKKAQEMQGG